MFETKEELTAFEEHVLNFAKKLCGLKNYSNKILKNEVFSGTTRAKEKN